ncbi:hypothetical protein T11_12975 [Trichinella zimbabwensis]|uniref:Uncharacterized protein n=1 Tax=Trichinella zimbabwensis TaxID=268475 RepID=A0A0V1I3K2_9BILA|nr:hypothetical protein T11_12975 [Trichinella zimbabwensis]
MAALSKGDSEGHSACTANEDSEPLSLTLQSMQGDEVSSFSSSTFAGTLSMRSEMEDSEALQMSMQSAGDDEVFTLTADSGVTDEEWSESTEDSFEKSFNYYVTIYPKCNLTAEREIAMLKAEAKRRHAISDHSFDSQALMESLSSTDFNLMNISSSESSSLMMEQIFTTSYDERILY